MREMTIVSDVAGVVWKLEVDEGDVVEGDQTLIVFESMKMEIPLTAPEPGKIARVLVKAGEVVSEGQNVIVLLVG
jgi:acetyl-CoA carboxylase biotin carboxyl carrier protein